jgi:hypothetical protein
MRRHDPGYVRAMAVRVHLPGTPIHIVNSRAHIPN